MRARVPVGAMDKMGAVAAVDEEVVADAVGAVGAAVTRLALPTLSTGGLHRRYVELSPWMRNVCTL